MVKDLTETFMKMKLFFGHFFRGISIVDIKMFSTFHVLLKFDKNGL